MRSRGVMKAAGIAERDGREKATPSSRLLGTQRTISDRLRRAHRLPRMNTPPFSLSDAWDHACRWLERIAALFGDPVAIRDQGEMRRADMRRLIAWLKPLEDFVRRLLVIQACRAFAAQAQPRAVPRAPARTAQRRGRRRASFRVLPSTEHQGARARRPSRRRAHANDLLLSAPLARRYDALVSALVAPDRIVARLARRLAREAARVRAFITTPRRHRVRDAVVDAVAQAVEMAFAAALPAHDSS